MGCIFLVRNMISALSLSVLCGMQYNVRLHFVIIGFNVQWAVTILDIYPKLILNPNLAESCLPITHFSVIQSF